MAKIHMVLQGKGGVGKSMIAATIAQYKASKGQMPLCIDRIGVDAVNIYQVKQGTFRAIGSVESEYMKKVRRKLEKVRNSKNRVSFSLSL